MLSAKLNKHLMKNMCLFYFFIFTEGILNINRTSLFRDRSFGGAQID